MCVSSNIRYPQSKSIWCHVWSKLVGSKWKAYECECKDHRHEPLRRNSKLYGIHDPIDCSLSPQTNSYSNNQELESCREVAVARARASQTTRTFSRQISSQPKQRPHTAPKQLVLSGCRESRPPSVRWGSTWGGAWGMRGTLSSPLESLCTRCTRRARRSRCTAACLVPPQRLDRGSMHGRRSTARLPWPFAVAPEAVRIDVLDHSRRQRALHLGGKQCACTRRPRTFFVQRTRTGSVRRSLWNAKMK